MPDTVNAALLRTCMLPPFNEELIVPALESVPPSFTFSRIDLSLDRVATLVTAVVPPLLVPVVRAAPVKLIVEVPDDASKVRLFPAPAWTLKLAPAVEDKVALPFAAAILKLEED